MPVHKVTQGEWLAKIAKAHKVPGAKTIYDAPENETLRSQRPDPYTLFPGDEVFIPEEPGAAESVRTSRQIRMVVTLDRLRLVLRDHEGHPFASQPCSVTLDGQDTVELETDADGLLEIPVRGTPESGSIEMGDWAWTLDIGHLNPMRDTPDEGVSGAQARLVNLGYEIGEVDGNLGPRTRAALRALQREFDLKITGKLDPETVDALLEQHGS